MAVYWKLSVKDENEVKIRITYLWKIILDKRDQFPIKNQHWVQNLLDSDFFCYQISKHFTYFLWRKEREFRIIAKIVQISVVLIYLKDNNNKKQAFPVFVRYVHPSCSGWESRQLKIVPDIWIWSKVQFPFLGKL